MLLLKPSTGSNLILRPQDRPAYYPPPTIEAAYVIVYWRVRRTDGTVDAWHEHDRIAPTAQTTIHHNPNEDQMVDVALMPISASGVPGFASIDDAFAATAVLQRETEAPTVSQVGAATPDLLTLAIEGYTGFARRRRVRLSNSSDMANALEMVTGAPAGRELDRLVTITRAAATTRLNVALSGSGATATASSAAYPPGNSINGERTGAGFNWWEAAGGVPDMLEVNFGQLRTINEFAVITVQDNYQHPVQPDETLIFTRFGVTQFEIQAWDGAAWAIVPGCAATGNNKVLRRFVLNNTVTTTKARLVVQQSADGGVRVVEFEAYAGGSLTREIYVRISHSSSMAGEAWSAESVVQTFSFAGSAGAGGTSGTAQEIPRDTFDVGTI